MVVKPLKYLAGSERIMERSYFIANHIVISLLMAFTLLLSKEIIMDQATTKTLLMCYTNIVFICVLIHNHVALTRS